MSPSLRRTAIAALAACCLHAPQADAQTIRPLVAEFRADARGRLELVNESDEPLTAVLELRGFRVDEAGAVHDQALAPGLQVKLSSSSVRIPPRQTRFVFYDATSVERPAWFAVLARFAGYSRSQFNGLAVQLELPHFVYLLPPSQWSADDIRISEAVLDREHARVELVVENLGASFGRISAVDVRGAGQRASAGGFPLFPGGQRRLRLEWAGDRVPEAVAIRSQQFTIERPLPVARP